MRMDWRGHSYGDDHYAAVSFLGVRMGVAGTGAGLVDGVVALLALGGNVRAGVAGVAVLAGAAADGDAIRDSSCFVSMIQSSSLRRKLPSINIELGPSLSS
jgi:hypothetical protein